jgi:hypothetical protein
MNYLELVDSATLEGTTIDELKEALQNTDKDRKFAVISPEDLKFFCLDKYTPVNMTGVIVPPAADDGYTTRYNRMFVPGYIKQLPEELRRESINVGVFYVDKENNELVPVSVSALDDLQTHIGISGRATDYKSPLLMQLLCEMAKNQFDKVYMNPDGTFAAVSNGNSQKENYVRKKATSPADKHFGFTVVLLKDHMNQDIRKVFSFRSERYVPIPQESIIECIHNMQMMGKPELHHWKMSHFMTEADVTFPEVGDEFSNRFNLKDKVIPTFRINTSDTGRSSLRISKYLILERTGKEIPLRLPECEQERKYELTRHFGRTDIAALICKINSNLFATFKRVPELMTQLMFMGAAPVKEVLAAGFRAMNLQRHAGVVIAQELEEKIVEEIASQLPLVQDVMDTVYAALFAADNDQLTISDHQREELRNNALLSVFPVDVYKAIADAYAAKTAQAFMAV